MNVPTLELILYLFKDYLPRGENFKLFSICVGCSPKHPSTFKIITTLIYYRHLVQGNLLNYDINKITISHVIFSNLLLNINLLTSCIELSRLSSTY